ncbi:MAG TPA: oligogalacturonate lyase family protein [Candidatus Latescibacteria bacterium]|nr:oligogalacturonate lyase family protein [Candidatus Latescibacterota bacterium]
MPKGAVYPPEMSKYVDPVSGNEVVQLTSTRKWNVHPTYHVNGFLDDQRIVFAAEAEGATNIYVCSLVAGEITQLTAGIGTSYLLAYLAGERGDGRGTDAFHIVAGYSSHAVYFVEGDELRTVNADTLEEESLYRIGPEWVCGVLELSGDEQTVLLPLLPRECFNTRGDLAEFLRRTDRLALPSRLVGVSVGDARSQVLWEDAGRFIGHAAFSPVSDKLVLCERATDPDRRDEPLLWLLKLEDEEAIPFPTRNPKTGHSVWLPDGTGVVTHGMVVDGGREHGAEYIQILNLDTSTRWIGYHGPPRYYGHCHTTPDGQTIIVDGVFAPDQITAVTPHGDGYFTEPICVHGTDSSGGQRAHAHPHVSPNGEWLVFGSLRGGRKDLFAVRVKGLAKG